VAEVARPEVVVDTDVLSFIFNRDLVRGSQYEQVLEDRRVVVPFVVVGEMRFGATAGGWGTARRARLEEFLFDFRHAYADDQICTLWATLRPTSAGVDAPSSARTRGLRPSR
jgi:predicted nucleic acid-binding protein